MSDNPLEQLASEVRKADVAEVPLIVAAFAEHFVVMTATYYQEMMTSIYENMADKNRELDYLRNLTGLTPVVESTATEADL